MIPLFSPKRYANADILAYLIPAREKNEIMLLTGSWKKWKRNDFVPFKEANFLIIDKQWLIQLSNGHVVSRNRTFLICCTVGFNNKPLQSTQGYRCLLLQPRSVSSWPILYPTSVWMSPLEDWLNLFAVSVSATVSTAIFEKFHLSRQY